MKSKAIKKEWLVKLGRVGVALRRSPTMYWDRGEDYLSAAFGWVRLFATVK